MELNAEQIKKALKEMNMLGVSPNAIRKAVALINFYEQKTFELENRLKECENGYEGTLFLDRCKLHDAEEKIRELTQAHQMLSESYDHLVKTKDELLSERAKLVEENERLINDGFDITDYAVEKIRKVKSDTVRKIRSKLYENFLKIAKCQTAGEPNMKSQEVFAILEQIAKEMLEEK